MIDLALIDKLNILYDRVPFSITRMLSTPAHNKAVGGKPHSWHVDLSADPGFARACGAADLIFDTPALAQRGVQEAQRLGFGGIEWDMTNNHLHLDMRPTRWWVMHTEAGEQTLPMILPPVA